MSALVSMGLRSSDFMLIRSGPDKNKSNWPSTMTVESAGSGTRRPSPRTAHGRDPGPPPRVCDPSPEGTADDSFVEHHRKASRCLDEMLGSAGLSVPKGSQPRDDALDEASQLAIERLCARVPDLIGLADLLCHVVSGAT